MGITTIDFIIKPNNRQMDRCFTQRMICCNNQRILKQQIIMKLIVKMTFQLIEQVLESDQKHFIDTIKDQKSQFY
ncbi:hypothetical protein pb186bvf_015027 [Paramecium bursaria]